MNKLFLRLVVVLIVCAAIVIGITLATQSNSLKIVDYPAMLVLAVIAFAIQWVVFIPAYALQTEKFYDLTGSLTFITILAVSVTALSQMSWYQIALALMVGVWALRLGTFLFARILKDGADNRFDDIKPNPIRFFTAWTIQGLWVFLTSAAVTVALVSLTIVDFDSTYTMTSLVVGGAFWIIGFVLEVVADAQKRQFKKQKDTGSSFIKSGLWRVSRHPNYFGEILLWFGAAIFALPALAGWQHIVLISPLFVTLLLTKVSGVPLLEKKADAKFGHLDEYQDYKKATPVLIPRVKS